MSNAAMIKETAAGWLERRIAEDWRPEDQVALDAWLDENTAHRIAYLRLEAVWTRTYQFAPLRRRQPPRPEGRFHFSFGRMAAGLIVLVALGGGLSILTRAPEQKSFTTGLGERETITLADGSKIELNTESALRLAANDPRKVWLDKGEAFFQVHHDAKHPFVVTVGDHRITDLGTKFSIRRDSGQMRVAVVEGQVSVASVAGHTKPVLLKAGDVGLAKKEAMSLSKKAVVELEDESAWQKGLFMFHHTTLADAASQYNRYNRAKIVIADAGAAKLTINGALPTNDVDAFVRLTQKFFDLRVERRQGQIVLSR
jgi:transmembrane sensor